MIMFCWIFVRFMYNVKFCMYCNYVLSFRISVSQSFTLVYSFAVLWRDDAIGERPLLKIVQRIAIDCHNVIVIRLVDCQTRRRLFISKILVKVVVFPLLTTRVLVTVSHFDDALSSLRVQAQRPAHQMVSLRVLEHLIATLAMAKRGANVLVSLAAHAVQTEVQPDVLDCTDVIEVHWDGSFRIDVLQVPAERLALQIFAELNARAHVTGVDVIEIGNHVMKVSFVLVGPHVDQAPVVLEDDFVGAARERVGRLLAEYMAHVRARRDQQNTSAHPNSERHF